MADTPRDALLLETFGARLLGYLTNLTEEQVETLLRDDTELPRGAEVALAQLLPLARRVTQDRLEHPGLPISFALTFLGGVPPGSDTSVGNLIRITAGGDVDTTGQTGVEAADRVKTLLFQLARDAYPQLLAPLEEPWHHPHLMFFTHPARTQLQEALDADQSLSKLYPADDGDLGRRARS